MRPAHLLKEQAHPNTTSVWVIQLDPLSAARMRRSDTWGRYFIQSQRHFFKATGGV